MGAGKLFSAIPFGPFRQSAPATGASSVELQTRLSGLSKCHCLDLPRNKAFILPSTTIFMACYCKALLLVPVHKMPSVPIFIPKKIAAMGQRHHRVVRQYLKSLLSVFLDSTPYFIYHLKAKQRNNNESRLSASTMLISPFLLLLHYSIHC